MIITSIIVAILIFLVNWYFFICIVYIVYFDNKVVKFSTKIKRGNQNQAIHTFHRHENLSEFL